MLERFRPLAQEPLFLLYQSRKHLSPRVRAFLDFMEARFGQRASVPDQRWVDDLSLP